jgi:branched-chain amino acid aminotransferase
MTQQIYINGEYFSKDDAKISVFDHGLIYGDGIFEGLRIYGGKVFRLHEHLLRLYESAKALRLTIPMSIDELKADVLQAVAKNELPDGYIRLVVTRGSGPLGLDPFQCSNPQIIIIVQKMSIYPEEYYEKGLELMTASTIRNHPAALSPGIKSLNYLNNVLAKMEGLSAGCIETLMMNHKGEVAECTGDNLFLVKNGVISTPPKEAGILAGVTRNAVMELAYELEIHCIECSLPRHDIFVADECFLTGTAAEVIGATRLDSRDIGDGRVGPVTRQLMTAFAQTVRK